MNWKNVKLIFLREVRDQLRDRRTLFMVAVLPLLLYPSLGVGMFKLSMDFQEQERTVLLLGVDDLPPPPLLDPQQPERFLPEFFETETDVSKLRVITEKTLLAPFDKHRSEVLQNAERAFIREALDRRQLLKELGRVSRKRQNARELGARLSYGGEEKKTELEATKAQIQKLEAEELALKAQVDAWFGNSPVEVMIVIPENFAKELEAANRELVQRTESGAEKIDAMPRPVIVQNSADEKSQIASRRIKSALHEWESRLRDARLEEAGLPRSLSSPVDATSIDVAAKDDIASNMWSKMFPALLVMMGVTGAFYPAIDLGAGEKERGTMETLLISPARRSEIVVGKFLTVLVFSISTAVLNMASMGFTGRHVMGMSGGGLLDVALPPLSSLAWVLVLAVPLCSLFSATSLACAMFARSSKEGQYYLTPLLMGTMGLTMYCLGPSVTITPYLSVMPVAGPALLLKALLHNSTPLGEIAGYFLPVIGSSFFYSYVALQWAIDLFDREEILFREAERFDLALWIKHVLRDKDPVPSRAMAALCFVVIAMTQFSMLGFIQKQMLTEVANPSARNATMLLWQTIYLFATVGAPPLLMAMLLTSNFRRTLKLYWPKWQYLAVGIALPFTIQPIAVELIHNLEWFFPKLPDGAAKLMQALGDKGTPIWWPLMAVAIAPAICEELAFRGFILSGLQSHPRKRFWPPIVVSAVLFGVIHMIAHQVFNAALLGIVIAILAVRSRSLLPGILFHFIFNAMHVVTSRAPAEMFQTPEMRFLFTYIDGTPRCNAPLLAICGLLSMAMVTWLLKTPSDALDEVRRESDLTAETPPEEDESPVPMRPSDQ
ncbi:MAG: CPBP family intramembrane metalloprotease [Planctomycetota bacterium]|nr:MAG: CPBP family intramembrane metalloprotease [Planctomycetota bacterium]